MAELTAPETSEFKFKLLVSTFFFLEFLGNKLVLSSKHYETYTPAPMSVAFLCQQLKIHVCFTTWTLKGPFPKFCSEGRKGPAA